MHPLVTRQNLGLVLGPLLFVAMLLLPLPADMSPDALKVAAVACLMALWWVSEAAPIAATALLPIVLFPVLGVMSTAATTSATAINKRANRLVPALRSPPLPLRVRDLRLPERAATSSRLGTMGGILSILLRSGIES